ncbi:MAG TPA: hypothetical protein VNA04_16825 [Thermoanaerobaculia bacterium]|nr:hypothetical protein [Thermoanaerobaculia bacterium]
MSYDLAIMALEGLAKSPLTLRVEADEVVLEGSAASFKELARLCLLIGGAHLKEELELQPSVHLTAGSPQVRFRLGRSTEAPG